MNYFKLPAGGRYGIIRETHNDNLKNAFVQILSGGSTIEQGADFTIDMMYIRLS